MKIILVSAYAANPNKGSEDAMGWNYIMQISRFQKVIAITRENNKEHIEKYMRRNPNERYSNIQFLYFDLPYWQRFWKKGGRGALLYFWLWQKGIISFIRRHKIEFDIAHNLNFHNDWTPSYLWKLNKPFVWGPVGHHPIIPKQYLQEYSLIYRLKNKLTWMVKNYFWKYSISLKKTIQKASYICIMNHSVSKVLNLTTKNFVICPSVASEDFGNQSTKDNKAYTLISAGRLVPLKGFDLTILAFSTFLNSLSEKAKSRCKLIIVGSGPELKRCKKLAKQQGTQNNISFVEWVERRQLMQLFRNSSAFLFPSHEGAGMVVSEALSFGLPVICLDNCGPGEFIDKSCGIAVPIQNYEKTVFQLAGAISRLFKKPELLVKMQKSARAKFLNEFHWDKRGEVLNKIYLQI